MANDLSCKEAMREPADLKGLFHLFSIHSARSASAAHVKMHKSKFETLQCVF